MSRKRVLACAVLIVVVLAVAGAACARHTPRLPGQSASEAGLLWWECAVPGSEPDWQRAGACTDAPPAVLAAAAMAPEAVSTGDGQELQIGTATFTTHRYRVPFVLRHLYVLRRNDWPQQVFITGLSWHNPDGLLTRIGGKIVWEFTADGRETIVHDGQDVRRLFGLEAAYAPYGLQDRLLFIARQAGQYVIVYDGRRIGPAFERILIAHCCDPFGYSARGSSGRYTFWGWRGGQLYLVMIQAL